MLRIQFLAATCSVGSLSRECVINICDGLMLIISHWVLGLVMATGSGRVSKTRFGAPKTRPSLSLQRKIHCHPAIHCDWWGQDFLTNRWVSRFEPSQPFGFIYVSHSPRPISFFRKRKRCLPLVFFFGCCCCLSILSHQIYGGRWYIYLHLTGIGLVGIPSDPYKSTIHVGKYTT